MSKIKSIKKKISATAFGDKIPLGADAVNVDMSDGTTAEAAILARATKTEVGSLTDLTTSTQDSIVDAINEINVKVNLTQLQVVEHTNIYRGINLLSSGHFASIDDIATAVSAGDFSDIYVGDYFDITIHSGSYSTSDNTFVFGTGTQTVRMVVMDIDYCLTYGDTSLTVHHLVLVPRNCLGTAYMNSSNTTSGGYYNSNMHQVILPAFLTELQTAIGASHIITYRDLMSTAINTSAASSGYPGWTGASSSWSWYDTNIRLLPEPAVYGSPIFSSSGYDTGIWKKQLAGFRLNSKLMAKAGSGTGDGGRHTWWLSSVASSTNFAYVNYIGNASTWGAGANLLGVVPLVLFG